MRSCMWQPIGCNLGSRPDVQSHEFLLIDLLDRFHLDFPSPDRAGLRLIDRMRKSVASGVRKNVSAAISDADGTVESIFFVIDRCQGRRRMIDYVAATAPKRPASEQGW